MTRGHRTISFAVACALGALAPAFCAVAEPGGGAGDMFSGYNVGGGRRHSSPHAHAQDSFATGGSVDTSGAVVDGRSRAKGGPKIILPSFADAGTSAVVPTPTPAPPPPQAAPPPPPAAPPAQNRLAPAAQAIAETLSSTTATTSPGSGPPGIPSTDYYRSLISQVQGHDKAVQAEQHKAVEAPKGLGKDNRF